MKNDPRNRRNKREGPCTRRGASIYKRTPVNLSPIPRTSTTDTFLSDASELITLFRLLRRLLKLVICSSEILQKPLACISLRPLNSFLMTDPFKVAGSRDVQLTLHWGCFVGKLALVLPSLSASLNHPEGLILETPGKECWLHQPMAVLFSLPLLQNSQWHSWDKLPAVELWQLRTVVTKDNRLYYIWKPSAKHLATMEKLS